MRRVLFQHGLNFVLEIIVAEVAAYDVAVFVDDDVGGESGDAEL